MQSSELRKWLNAAATFQSEADGAGIGRTDHRPTSLKDSHPNILNRFNEAVTCESLRLVCRKLFVDGHYSRAVEEAFKCLSNTVRAKSGLDAKGGAD